MSSPVLSQTQQQQPEKGGGSSLSRKFSTKRLFLNSSTSKANSPTHIPHSSIPENPNPNPLRSAAYENSNLDPSAAALAATSTLSANGGPRRYRRPRIRSISRHRRHRIRMRINRFCIPAHTPPLLRRNPRITRLKSKHPNTARQFYPSSNDDPNPYLSGTTAADSDRERDRTATPNFTSRQQRDQQRGEPGARIRTGPQDRGSRRHGRPPSLRHRLLLLFHHHLATRVKITLPAVKRPSVEIFKSFRVSMEDPCWKVLPAALKKYQINADWRQYALYIVYGDQERCLGLEEKPLISVQAVGSGGEETDVYVEEACRAGGRA